MSDDAYEHLKMALEKTSRMPYIIIISQFHSMTFLTDVVTFVLSLIPYVRPLRKYYE